jgi:hypothetical protein
LRSVTISTGLPEKFEIIVSIGMEQSHGTNKILQNQPPSNFYIA